MKLHEVVFLFTCVTFQFFYIDLLAEHGTKGTVSLGYHLDIYEEDFCEKADLYLTYSNFI